MDRTGYTIHMDASIVCSKKLCIGTLQDLDVSVDRGSDSRAGQSGQSPQLLLQSHSQVKVIVNFQKCQLDQKLQSDQKDFKGEYQESSHQSERAV